MSKRSSTWALSLLVGALATPAVAAPADAGAPAPSTLPEVPAATNEPAPALVAPIAEPTPSAVAVSPAPTPASPTASPRVVVNEPVFDDAGTLDDGSLGAHQTHFWISAGARTTFVKSKGFDVFAGDDVLAQGSFALGRVIYADGPWSFAASADWDYGSRSASVRGAATSLEVHRFTLVPEGRYHFMRRLYAFARVGVGGALLMSSLADPIAGGERTRQPLRVTFDTSAGAAFEVLGARSGAAHSARVWLVLDAGYLFTSSTDLVYSSASGAPVRSTPIALGDLALNGFSGRLAAAVTF